MLGLALISDETVDDGLGEFGAYFEEILIERCVSGFSGVDVGEGDDGLNRAVVLSAIGVAMPGREDLSEAVGEGGGLAKATAEGDVAHGLSEVEPTGDWRRELEARQFGTGAIGLGGCVMVATGLELVAQGTVAKVETVGLAD